MSNIKLLFKRCNHFHKLSNILPPPLEEGESYDMPEIPKNPIPSAFKQETIETIRPEKAKKHHIPVEIDEEDERETIPVAPEGATILAPESLQDVVIPRPPRMPRDMAITEIPPSSKKIFIVLDEDGHFSRENNPHLFEDGKLKFDKSDVMSAIRQAKRDFVG